MPEKDLKKWEYDETAKAKENTAITWLPKK
jgi:hypothetical protein